MIRIFLISLFTCFLISGIIAQTGFSSPAPAADSNQLENHILKSIPDSLGPASSLNRSRVWFVSAIHAGLYGGSLLVLNEAWYKNYPKRGFTSFDDSKEWLQMDKIGHGWSAYNLSRASTAAWKWAGLSKRKSAIIGSSSGFAFLTVIEFLDAYSTRWGWSWSDIAANSVGTGLFLGQELAWNEQRIQFKFSFHRKNYSDESLNSRSDQLFGKSWYERMLKDYNGQTYWLSTNLKSFFRQSNLPDWLSIAVGYGADGMHGGFENISRDGNGTIVFDRTDIPRVRQFYLAPDIDLTKIRTNKRWLKTILLSLNSFKFPAPTLMLNSNGKWRFHPFYF